MRRVVNQIIRYGRVMRPGLGLLCVPDDTALKVLGPGNRAVIIRDVVPGSGAAEANLRCASFALQVMFWCPSCNPVLNASSLSIMTVRRPAQSSRS